MPFRPPTIRLASALAALTAGALVLGCASRAVPERFPATAAASPQAREASPVTVTTALDADPPLPGAETEPWSGLRPAGSAAPAHGGHHGH